MPLKSDIDIENETCGGQVFAERGVDGWPSTLAMTWTRDHHHHITATCTLHKLILVSFKATATVDLLSVQHFVYHDQTCRRVLVRLQNSNDFAEIRKEPKKLQTEAESPE